MIRFADIFTEIILRGPVGRGNVGDGILPVVEQVPIGFEAGSMGEKTAHTDDGDRGGGHVLVFVNIHGLIPKTRMDASLSEPL
jgi:hypothetical protein